MSKRLVLGLNYTIEALKREGINIDAALTKIGLSSYNLDSSAMISTALELEFFNELTPCLPSPDFGLELGAQFTLAGYGAFSMLLLSCATPLDAIQTAIKFQKLTYLYGELELLFEQERSALCYRPHHMPPSVERFLIDRDVAGTYRLVRDIQSYLNFELELDELWLPYAKPKTIKVHQQIFDCPIQFNKPEVRFYITNAPFNRQLPSASQAGYELYKTQCEKTLGELQKEEEDLHSVIRAHLNLFHYDFPTAAQVAKTLGYSERTLRRRLAEADISFQQIADEVKFFKAKSYLLESSESVEAVAIKLGYKEAASFIRAFQRWSGETPAKFRKKHA